LAVHYVTRIPKLPDRAIDAHKGAVGRIMVVGGSLGEQGMIGAPALTANACLRSGSGLVQILTERAAQAYLAVLAPCATTRRMPDQDVDLAALAVGFGADVVAVGPGMGTTVTGDQIAGLLNRFSGGVVVDADALNALATAGRWSAQWPHNVVVTPHPGEMSRLLQGRGLDDDLRHRERAAVRLATDTHCVVVLKGAGTVVTDGDRVYINQTGNSGMATAGSGDVLTGVIAALIGQKMSSFDAAVLGVHVHGLAGDSAAEQMGRISLMAADLLDFLPEAFCDLEVDETE
jgi:NAD(P)H-hydrate epimerase